MSYRVFRLKLDGMTGVQEIRLTGTFVTSSYDLHDQRSTVDIAICILSDYEYDYFRNSKS